MAPASSAFDSLRRHSASFYRAARLLPAACREDVARLYAGCRRLDDLADELPPREAEAALSAALEEIHHRQSECPAIKGLLELINTGRLEVPPLHQLTEALQRDAGPRHLADEAALVDFCYGVAGTVGMMLSPLLGAPSVQARAYAIDLGVAMQLSNIARDVLEDSGRDRCYLPESWLFTQPPTPSARRALLNGLQQADSVTRERTWPAIVRVLKLAEHYYASALEGVRLLPPGVRPAILVAALLYRDIGRKVLRLGPARYWQGRVVVGPGRKALLLLQAAGLLSSMALRPAPVPPHDPALHRYLTAATLRMPESNDVR